MEKGENVQDTLPTMYGIMIAFLTCLVGYALWVSLFMYLFQLIIFSLISHCSIQNVFNNHQ